MTRRFKPYRARLALVALAGALVVTALAPATASASHFDDSTKVCNQPGVCVLTIDVDGLIFEDDVITVDLDPGTTGATFRSATRTGGTCPPTSVSLVDSTTVHLDPSENLPFPGCTIVLEETLAATSAGEVCQTIDSDFSFPESTVCAQLTPAQCSDSADNDSDGKVDYPDDQGCEDAEDDSESPDPPQCSDRLDNDEDGQTNFPDDQGCEDAEDDSESPDPPQCSDRLDNDSDGKTNFPADPGCTSASDDSESPDPVKPPSPRPANPCTITGTRGNDIIRGTSGRDVICTGGGNDIVYGRGANDVIYGGSGNDILRGGDGSDRLIGGPGNDILHGDGGADSLNTQDAIRGNDVANGGAGDDSCATDPRDVRRSC